jgi:L1 cell adhesion molecule like protein
MVLGKICRTAEIHTHVTLTETVVITVPACFNYHQRQAIRRAGSKAQFQDIRVMNDTTAAALAYGLGTKAAHKENVIVFDLGGGTLDVSLLIIEDGIYEVVATASDCDLGGVDFDSRLVTYFALEFQQKHNKDLSADMRALGRLRSACECAKRTLSSSAQATMAIESLFEGIDFQTTITRVRFEELCHDLFDLSIRPVISVIGEAKIDKESIDEIILVGGSTHIPRIRELVSRFFNGKDLNMSINPEKAVAYGAAVESAIVSGKFDTNVLVMEVAPWSLGFENDEGHMEVLIQRNARIPRKRSQTFLAESCDTIISVYEGEHKKADQNSLLCEIQLSRILTEPSLVEVTFELHSPGILEVYAVEKTRGKRISGRFDQEDV